MADDDQPRLHAVTLGQGHHALGKRADELKLDNLRCSVSAIRRRGAGGRVDMNALLMEGSRAAAGYACGAGGS